MTITNNVDVTSNTADPSLGNNTDSEDTQVVAVADLEIVSFSAVNPPTEILVGQDVQITLRKVITNNGPSAPMDTLLQLNALPPLGGQATPMLAFINELALGLNEERVVDEVFTIRCNEASHHIFSFIPSYGKLAITPPITMMACCSNEEACDRCAWKSARL